MYTKINCCPANIDIERFSWIFLMSFLWIVFISLLVHFFTLQMKCQIEHTAFEGYNICCVQSKSSIVIFLKVLHAYRKYIYNYKLCTLEIELICHHEHLTTFRCAVVILCGVWKPSAVQFITFLMFEFKDILITAATWYLCPKAKAVENRRSSISMHYKPQNSNSDFMGAFFYLHPPNIFD